MARFLFSILLIVTFGTASIGKIQDKAVPDWFLQQFKDTLFDRFYGSLTISYILIFILEFVSWATLVCGYLIGIKNQQAGNNCVKFGYVMSIFTFTMLSFGQRITGKFDSAAQLFCYAALTILFYSHDDRSRA